MRAWIGLRLSSWTWQLESEPRRVSSAGSSSVALPDWGPLRIFSDGAPDGHVINPPFACHIPRATDSSPDRRGGNAHGHLQEPAREAPRLAIMIDRLPGKRHD